MSPNPQTTTEFLVPSRPVAKERPRHTARGNTYTPARTKRYEEEVAYYAMSTRAKYFGDVEVLIELNFSGGTIGDIDNYAKSVLDGLCKSGMIGDDRTVWKLTVFRKKTKKDGARVRVTGLLADNANGPGSQHTPTLDGL